MRFPQLRRFVLSSAIAALLLTGTASLIHPSHTAETTHAWSPLFRVYTPLVVVPVHAQPQRIRRPDPEAIAVQIYQQLPELPLENQYLGESGETAVNNTLVARLIRYHLYVQDRPTNFRLDWKLTIADYLGAFERIDEAQYPSQGLQQNPMAADITAIESLDVQLRDRLVNSLYQAFTVPASQSTSPPPAENN